MEKRRRSVTQESAEKNFKRIIKGLLALAVLLLFVHWAYSLCLAGFILWSASCYERGCMEAVCDEYEPEDGYPSLGLYRMFKRWKKFSAVWLVIVLITWAAVKFIL